jgi:hypothetical protein
MGKVVSAWGKNRLTPHRSYAAGIQPELRSLEDMFNSLKMRIAQVSEFIRSNGWVATLHELIFFRRTAVIIEKDLSNVAERTEPLVKSALYVREIDKSMLDSGEYTFAVKSRYYKALKYLKQGDTGFALLRGCVIVGDTWHWISNSTSDENDLHADLRCFRFRNWNKADVYGFDMFVAAEERKAGVSAAFQNCVMLSLRAKGYRKMLAYYWADNIRAYWCHRATNKWNELRRVKVSRFLTIMKSSPAEGKRTRNDPVGQEKAGCTG